VLVRTLAVAIVVGSVPLALGCSPAPAPDTGGAGAGGAGSGGVTTSTSAGKAGADGVAGAAGTAGTASGGAGGSLGVAGASGSGGSGMGGEGGGVGGGGASGGGVIKGQGACQMPATASFADAQRHYEDWKKDLLTADGAGGFLRVKRPNSGSQPNTSNSEGTAYGMEIALYMGDQETFDKLWQYEQLHRGKNGLMDWEIAPDGGVLSTGGASDGDEDMAFALVMADKKWGGKGSLSDTYANHAKKLIDLIWQYEVDHQRNDVLMPGDQFGVGEVINISYFAPAYYRIFGQMTGKTAEWNRTVKTSYDVLEATLNQANKNAQNGLVPAWSTPAGTPMAPSGTSQPTHHQLDSCRTPFRLAQDYCWFGEPRALAYLQKISGFYAGIGATQLVDGYNLDGSVFPGATLHLAAFVAGAGVGAMASSEHTQLRDDAYVALAGWQSLLGGSLYYNESWSMLSLLMMSGHFEDLTAP
jgi:endo-1,4-beta-D-glucanase Y